MDELVKRLCLRLAATSPSRATNKAEGARDPARRGFLLTVGKLTVGAAAAISGATLLSNKPAGAAPGLACCEGIACGFRDCLHGMAVGYTWSCGGYFCHDCFTDHGNGNYYCTYTVARALRTSSTRRTNSRRAHTRTYYTPEYYTSDFYYGPPAGYWGD